MSYFQDNLSAFVKNFAYGDAIRHLVDSGYTTERIIREFHYPLPKEEIEKIVEKRKKEIEKNIC